MGYEVKGKIYKLRFEDPDMKGLVVRITPAPVGVILAATKLANLQDFDFSNVSSLDDESLAAINELSGLFESFVSSLVEWNVTRNGKPVPITMAGLKTLSSEFVMAIINAWSGASSGVPDPLEPQQSVGQPSQVALLPMERSLPSQAS